MKLTRGQRKKLHRLHNTLSADAGDPDFYMEAIEALADGFTIEDVILAVYAVGAGRGLKAGRKDKDYASK